jgi:hypothetical protein
MFINEVEWLRTKYCKFLAAHKARNTYPESIELDLGDLLSKPRNIKVTIIDDAPFPWINAIESRGCAVAYHQDYTKPIAQANQKIKVISTQSSDIIICDINGVGSARYPGLDGVGVIDELRQKHPLHVIAAYTGNPGAIHSKLKKKHTLDGILSRDWGIEDFLFNFDELLKIFRLPSHRWQFIQSRLKHLGVKEKDIEPIRRRYVENILLCQMLKEKFNCNAKNIEKIIKAQDGLDINALTKAGLGAIEAWNLLSPLVLESTPQK